MLFEKWESLAPRKGNKLNWHVASLLLFFIASGFFAISLFTQNITPASAEKTITELNFEIDDKRDDIKILEKEIEAYREQINSKRDEVETAQDQLAIIDNQIASKQLEIEATELKIESTNAEIQKLNLEINLTLQSIKEQKTKLSEYIRIIYQSDQVSYLEVLLLNDSFTEFFDYIQQTESIHGGLNEALDNLIETQKELEAQLAKLEQQKEQENQLKNALLEQKAELEEKQNAQSEIVYQVQLSQKQYQNYLYQLQIEQQQINAEINGLEKKLREELQRLEEEDRISQLGSSALSWPIPQKGITAYFHDPDYPFRYLFEHPAVDLRASQGTPIKAPANGYVGKVKFPGDTSYSYIMLIHADGISTVYGHISGATVSEDEFVTRGQVIGYTGGAPGSIGAGNLSTGAHLHLEVRLDGIPVDPLQYLP